MGIQKKWKRQKICKEEMVNNNNNVFNEMFYVELKRLLRTEIFYQITLFQT